MRPSGGYLEEETLPAVSAMAMSVAEPLTAPVALAISRSVFEIIKALVGPLVKLRMRILPCWFSMMMYSTHSELSIFSIIYELK